MPVDGRKGDAEVRWIGLAEFRDIARDSASIFGSERRTTVREKSR
jgi:hypothetical protein